MKSSCSFSVFRNLMNLRKACRLSPFVRSLSRSDQFTEVRMLLEKCGGGSVDLYKNEDNGIATLLINNPAKKNALSGKMMLDLHCHVSDLEKWETGKAVILAGVGGIFCSGGDLGIAQELDKNGGGLMSKFMHNVTSKLLNLPLVSVAAINGYAIGGGAELATACDFRIMSSKAKTGFVQVKLNVAPGWGGGTRLVKLLGRTKALELLISGAVIDATQALEWGFANEIAPETEDIVEEGQKWLMHNCKGNASTIQVLKTLVAVASNRDMESSLVSERDEFCKLWGSPSHREAFAKKTKHK